MTLEEIANALAAIERTYDERRIEVWSQVVEPDGTLAERVYQGAYLVPCVQGSKQQHA
jgi:hypothetical protein